MADTQKPKREVIVAMDPVSYNELKKQEAEDIAQENETGSTASKRDVGHLNLILNSLKKHDEQQDRMAFEINPNVGDASAHASLYRQKIGLIPDFILKRIAGPQGDDLVNQILQARSNIMSSFGRPRTSRFSIGFEFQEINKKNEPRTPQEAEDVKTKLQKAKEIMWNCGFKGLDEDWHPTFSQFLKMVTRDALAGGRIAVELIWAKNPKNPKEEICHSFRAVDALTIYRIVPSQKKNKQRRQQALQLLQRIHNKKIDVEKYDKDEYKWVQVIDGDPVQVFTEKELLVYNIYPTTNVEFNGYPLTPIDQALTAISTHINISLHNKLYFEHGRASRGMLVFQSDDIDEGTIQKIRLQFHQSINSVSNSWRMPVFAVGSQDKVQWQSIDIAGRDKEFQFLSDDTARVIMGAFQISPDELPGYAHLSRGTNTQALSESDNEYKLTAARDIGLRPLMYDIQDLLNTHILPKFDHELSRTHQLVFSGLDHDSPERESTRIAQDSAIHMTYDEIMEMVEKKKVSESMGGNLPLNQAFIAAISPFKTVGEILENFFGQKGAAKDPRFNYIRDPFWLQFQQLEMQKAQMAMQQQMAQIQQQQQSEQQQMAAEQGGEQGEPPPQEAPANPNDTPEQQAAAKSEYMAKKEEWLVKNYEKMNKSIANNHNQITKLILARHKELTEKRLKEWSSESKNALKLVLDAVKGKIEE